MATRLKMQSSDLPRRQGWEIRFEIEGFRGGGGGRGIAQFRCNRDGI